MSFQTRSSSPREFYFDEVRICTNCKRPFIFFAEEQKDWYEQLGFSLKVDCLQCAECRTEVSSPVQLRNEFESLLASDDLSPDNRLRAAELCLDLIEIRSLDLEDVGTVHRLISSVNQPESSRRLHAILERAGRLEAPSWSSGEPTFLLEAFPPSQNALLQMCSANLATDMVEEISRADAGYSIEKHFEEVERIRTQGFGPDWMGWEPLEVLETQRWSPPRDSGWEPYRGHTIRAFCCAALVTAATTPINKGIVRIESDTLIQLIDSVLGLQSGFPQATAQLLLYAIPRCERDERVVSACGLLVLSLHPSVEGSWQPPLDLFLNYIEGEFDACEKEGTTLTTSLDGILTGQWYKHFSELEDRYNYPRLGELGKRVLA